MLVSLPRLKQIERINISLGCFFIWLNLFVLFETLHYTIQTKRKRESEKERKIDLYWFILDQQHLLQFHLQCKYFPPRKEKKTISNWNQYFISYCLPYHLPNLHDIIFRNWTNYPRFIGIPWKIRDLGCMSTMNELNE